MPTLIYEYRGEYIQALQAVDESQRNADVRSEGDQVSEADLSAMVDFLRRMLMKQFASAIDRLASPSHPVARS